MPLEISDPILANTLRDLGTTATRMVYAIGSGEINPNAEQREALCAASNSAWFEIVRIVRELGILSKELL